MLGEKFGRLTVVSKHPERKRAYIQWVCQCECGNEVVVISNKLRSGHTKSCGCLQKDTVRKIRTKHGESRNKNPLYIVWSGMRARCNDPRHQSYDRYGKRGIKVCSEWDDFENFRLWAQQEGYAKGLQIDRIDNEKGYCPENCKWVTHTENMRNKTNNVFVDGIHLTDWFKRTADNLGITETAVISRYYRLKELGVEPTFNNIQNYN